MSIVSPTHDKQPQTNKEESGIATRGTFGRMLQIGLIATSIIAAGISCFYIMSTPIVDTSPNLSSDPTAVINDEIAATALAVASDAAIVGIQTLPLFGAAAHIFRTEQKNTTNQALRCKNPNILSAPLDPLFFDEEETDLKEISDEELTETDIEDATLDSADDLDETTFQQALLSARKLLEKKDASLCSLDTVQKNALKKLAKNQYEQFYSVLNTEQTNPKKNQLINILVFLVEFYHEYALEGLDTKLIHSSCSAMQSIIGTVPPRHLCSTLTQEQKTAIEAVLKARYENTVALLDGKEIGNLSDPILFDIQVTLEAVTQAQRLNQRTLAIHFSCDECGMFSVLTHVLGSLKQVEAGSYAGLAIDYGKQGLYYDPEKGENWWNYFFLPLPKPADGQVEYSQFSDYAKTVYEAEGKLSRQEAHELIQKHIRIRPEIQQEVDDFVRKNFEGQGLIIGVHYRGTDKGSETAKLDHEKVFERLDRYLNGTQQIDNFKIFVATDEEAFIQAMEERFPGRIIKSNTQRSQDGRPLHFNPTASKYEMGKSALIDALLLSRTQVLFRTSSNLSLWSTYFNPNMRVFSLSERHKGSELDQATSQIFLSAKAPDFPRGNGRCTHGMFATLQCMLGILHEYDSKQYGGIQIDFQDAGCYYSSEKGENWWQYYFEPVKQGSSEGKQVRTFEEMKYANPCWVGEKVLLRKEAHKLIQKYFKVRPEIQQEVDAFAEKHFQGLPVISVHYRGTDKISEAPRTEYQKAINAVKEYVAEKELKDFKIFVASDEVAFIDAISEIFPGHVVTTNAKRSTGNKPIHLDGGNTREAYERGKEALIDALLLAKGDEVLLRTSSNLSQFSTFLSPDLPEIALSYRH